jgi:hypothetical protein
MTEYEKLLDKMQFEIESTLKDNHYSRTGEGGSVFSEEEILKSSKRTYVNLKMMMMRLERELFGEATNEGTDETSGRITSRNYSASREKTTVRSRGPSDFSC